MAGPLARLPNASCVHLEGGVTVIVAWNALRRIPDERVNSLHVVQFVIELLQRKRLDNRTLWIYISFNVYPSSQGGRDMRIAKWGNSLAVRLPAAVVEALELKEGDEIEICVADHRQLDVARKPGREDLLRRLRAYRGRLPADFKFDRDEANAR